MLPPTLLAALLLGLLALPAAGQLSDEPPPALEAARTVLRFFTDDTPDHANFVAQHLSSDLRVQEGDDVLVNALEVLRTTLDGRLPDEVLEGEPGEMIIGFPQKGDAVAVRLHVRIDLAAPEQIADVWIEGGQGLDSSEDHAPPKPLGPITWDNLEARPRE